MARKSNVAIATTDNAQSKKFALLQKVCSEIQSKFGKESVNFLGNNKVAPIPRVTSGSRVIDQIIGGGYPLGRIIEIFGPASSGKTTVCYHAIAEFQKAFPDKWCGFVDSEYSYDPEYSANVGVNVAELVVAQPDSGTDAFAMVQAMIENGASLVVVDSVAAMVPREEVEEEDYGKSQIGVQARMMSKGLRKLTSVIGKYQCVIIFTNQTRTKIGVLYGDPSVTAGGNSLQYYASIRLKVTKTGVVEEGHGDDKEKTSITTRVEAVKNKTFPPFRRGEIQIVFGKGVDNEAGVLEEIISNGIIQKKGGWYAYEGTNVAQGLINLKIWISQHQDEYQNMKKKLEEITSSQVVEETPDENVEETSSDEEMESTETGEIE